MPKKPDKSVLRYLRFCAYRGEEREENWIAKELGYESPEGLYTQLSLDGFPVCTVCGETPVQADHCKRRRKARKSTEEASLPSPQSAELNFRLALAWLEWDIESLPLFEERLQGERFVTTLEEPEDEELLLYRRMFYKSDWEHLCRLYGYDPAPDQLRVPAMGRIQPHGATRTPSRPLARLIAAYALVHEDLTALLDALHPDPTLADTKKLHEKVDELELAAGQLATLVRGGKVRRGPSTEEISMEEQRIAWAISRRREEGATDEKILRELAYLGHQAYDRCLTKDDISRLGDLRLKPPPY
jgi:hypothetical protein